MTLLFESSIAYFDRLLRISYPPDAELQVREHLRFLLDQIPRRKPTLRVKHVDLFTFILDYMTSRKLLDKARRRVKEQLKKIGGMEFFDVHFSYLDQDSLEEKFTHVPEQGGGALIPDGPLNPGVLHTIATGSGGHLGLYRLETQVTSGNGSLRTSGLGSSSAAREAIKVGFDYFKANAARVSASVKSADQDYHLHVVELHNTGPTTVMTLAAFVALCSGVLGRPLQSQLVVLGDMSLGGSISPVENLTESLQMAFDAGGKRILLPMASVGDIPTVPGELFAKFQTSFYADPADAVFKAFGVH